MPGRYHGVLPAGDCLSDQAWSSVPTPSAPSCPKVRLSEEHHRLGSVSRRTTSFEDREYTQQDLALPDVDFEGPSNVIESYLMKPRYPGGDVMNQTLWKKFGGKKGSWPQEELHYRGARLGEYARPTIMNKNLVGYLGSAPVPLSASDDELALMAQSSAAAKRAMSAAIYAQTAAAKADRFAKLGFVKLHRLLQDPPISVRPTADVFPFYSAALPAGACGLLACADALAASSACSSSMTSPPVPARHIHAGFLFGT
eukprot:TRINITY_DN73362_c0_g1_i1.p1 TRINITY_DN73362_c0_g1~~TRINITY_DN73362_c0_g1_i1.p1  ORF type:complete len:256 (+),score=41.15 TRINITY_DN73362_c0_g1_i1:119-886(+)